MVLMPAADVLLGFAESAARAWPGVGVTAEEFADHLRAALGTVDPATLGSVRGEELFLAFACMRRDAVAWREFDRGWLAKVPSWVARVSSAAAFGDEVRQRLAVKLIGDGMSDSKLTAFSGRGSLAGWLRVAAVREAYTLLRSQHGEVDAEDMLPRAPCNDAELTLLKRQSARVFRGAFDAVVASLPDEERSVLKLHYLDGLTLPEVGQVLRMSRASVSRLIVQSRARIVKRIEHILREELGSEAPRLDDLAALVKSQLGPSIARGFLDASGKTNTNAR